MDMPFVLNADQDPRRPFAGPPDGNGSLLWSREASSDGGELVDLDSWYRTIEGLPAEQSSLGGLNFTHTPELNIGATALGDVQNGVSRWAATVIEQQTEEAWPGSETTYTVFPDILSHAPSVYPHDAVEGGQTLEDEERVCYGMIHRVNVQLIGRMSDLSRELDSLDSGPTSNASDVRTCTLEPSGYDKIDLLLPNGTLLGHLQDNRRRALSKLLAMRPLGLEAMFLSSKLRAIIGKVTQKREAIVHVDINIYGLPSQAAEVGNHLSEHKVWLQKPDYYKKAMLYENPHKIRFPELDDMLQEEPTSNNMPTIDPTADGGVQQLEQAVLAATHRISRQTGVSGDQRLKTRLLPHQEKGLSFMLERESGEIPDEFRLWQPAVVDGRDVFVHRITKTRSAIRPEEKGGGILADEMGMGKTLSILALIIKTVESGHEWAEKCRQDDLVQSKIHEHAHSTLIVAPSEWLINEWMNEIRQHLGDAISCIKYHGQGRERDVLKLSQADIVFTTYKTLATDATSPKKDALHKINWFRVVLDEAHWIRRPATTFHRACASLSARSRWCLTGTPIQNGLEDIGALFVFLQAEPFHSLAQFRRFIVVPFQERDPIVIERLVMLYESLVIQRTKDLLDLPGSEEQAKELELSPVERSLYDRTARILARRLREQVGEREVHSRFGLFQVHLQLRLLCNHGTHQNLLSWTRGHQALDDREAFLAEVGFNAERPCVLCRQPRPVLASGNVRHDFVEQCPHIICAECSEDMDNSRSEGGSQVSDELPRHCPVCRESGKSIQNTASRTRDLEGDVEMQDAAEGGDETYFMPNGFSTKMTELVKDIKVAQDEMVRDKSNRLRKCKSIVFSCWTRTLDLISKHLQAENIDHLRIDGQSLLSKRQRILREFTSKRGAQVLLMTTGTGAYGLNLTAANRIFIVELQWNPSVERQAIARAIRINQRDKVMVTRYLMLDTVEQEMKSQQVNKRRAAQAGLKQQNSEIAEGEGNQDEDEEVREGL